MSIDSSKPPKKVNLIEQIIYSVYLLLSASAAFLGAQLAGPALLAFVILGFGVSSKRVVDLLEKNNYLHFVLILLIELLTVWAVSLLLKRRGWKWSTIGLGRRPGLRDVVQALKAYGMYLLLFIVIYQIEIATHLVNTEQGQQLGFDGTHGPQLILVLLSLVILPPIAEEILFRGYIFLGLRRKIPFITAALVTSILFGIAHLEFGGGTSLNWAAGIDTFTLSLVLSYAAEKNRSLWPNIYAHAMKNFLAFLLLFIAR